MDASGYQLKKPEETAAAQAFIDAIRTADDPLLRYQEGRPVIDVKHMLLGSIERYKSRPLFYIKDDRSSPYRAITYGEAGTLVDALGTGLLELGLKGKHVAIISENRYEWSVAYLAILCGVGVAVPLDRELPAAELEALIEEAEIEAVFFSDRFEGRFRALREKTGSPLRLLINMDHTMADDVMDFKEVLELGRGKIAAGDKSYLNAMVERDKMSVLLYTSGTTGAARGVMLSQGNLVTDVMAVSPLVEIRPEDIFFSCLPLSHSYECTCGLLVPIYKGAAVAYGEGLKHFGKNLAEAKPTVILGVPLLFEKIYKKIWTAARKAQTAGRLQKRLTLNRVSGKLGVDLLPRDLKKTFGGSLPTLICGGAFVDPALLKGLRAMGFTTLQGYGLTECGPVIALNPDKGMRNYAAGYVPPGMKIKALDPDPRTGVGELCVRGDNVMLGYYKDPEETARALQDGWFLTGDLGYVDSDGFVYVTGRKKNVIITKNGKNIYPEELEFFLNRLPLVEESIVWAQEDNEGDSFITATVRLCEKEVVAHLGEGYSRSEAEELLWHAVDGVNADLPFYKRIKKLHIRREALERNSDQKVMRFAEGNR